MREKCYFIKVHIKGVIYIYILPKLQRTVVWVDENKRKTWGKADAAKQFARWNAGYVKLAGWIIAPAREFIE